MGRLNPRVRSDTTGVHNKHQQIAFTALYLQSATGEDIDRLIAEAFPGILHKRIPRAKMHCVLVSGPRDVLSATERQQIGRCHDIVVYGFTKPCAPLQALLVHCPTVLPRSSTLAYIGVAGTVVTGVSPEMVEELPRKRWLTIRTRMGAVCRVVGKCGTARHRCRYKRVH